ncbi:MAG: NAD(P)-dependent oxidoreductase [Rhodocyclaceae bacterium]|nr:NAD(P)-dependent oxidoreductase [Rhodocyclaceae bacterium]
MKFTVLGATGFIGSHLVASLEAAGHRVAAPARGDPSVFSDDLGHAFYCIGLTADFRRRPFDTAEAHVCLLAEVLKRARFDSLLYLSSTRVYGRSESAHETALVAADVGDSGDLYNLTKLLGESLCLHGGREGVRVARVSNVYGGDFDSDNFLASILRDAIDDGKVVLRTSADSAKDYLSIGDLVALLPRIAVGGRHRIYNVASGVNLSHRQILQRLSEITGCRFEVPADAQAMRFPPIRIDRIREEFGFGAVSLLDDLPSLVEQFRAEMT